MCSGFNHWAGCRNVNICPSLPISIACCPVFQLCLTFCDLMDCSPPGSSVPGILQARMLEWVAIFLLQGNLPDSGIEPASPVSPTPQVNWAIREALCPLRDRHFCAHLPHCIPLHLPYLLTLPVGEPPAPGAGSQCLRVWEPAPPCSHPLLVGSTGAAYSLYFRFYQRTYPSEAQQGLRGHPLVCNLTFTRKVPWFDSWAGKIHWRRDRLPTPVVLGFPCGSAGKESACNVGDLGLILGLGRSPGEGKGYPLQDSGLENSMDCIVHGVGKSQTQLSNSHFH